MVALRTSVVKYVGLHKWMGIYGLHEGLTVLKKEGLYSVKLVGTKHVIN
jgi:hypothetical protein